MTKNTKMINQSVLDQITEIETPFFVDIIRFIEQEKKKKKKRYKHTVLKPPLISRKN
jgi:hypothetical protein